MNEILNNLEKISDLLANNNDFSIEDFTPISKLIAETQIKVIRLYEVGRSAKLDKPKFSVKCLHCGRSFIKKMPHKCNTGFRKRNHSWKELTDD